MEDMTHRDFIKLWDSLTVFAEDVGVPYLRANGWRGRDHIPGKYFARIELAAKSRGYPGVTCKALSEAAARKKLEAA